MTAQVRHLVVVGAGLAGLRAIEGARASGWTGKITLVGAEDLPPYDRPPLSKAFLAEGPLDVVTPFRSTLQLREELGVDVLLGTGAEDVDAQAHEIQLSDGRRVTYDSLVVATGADAVRLPGQDAVDGVTSLRTARDAARVRHGLDEGARVVVVGAGFVGSEVASAAHKRGLAVTVIDQNAVPLARAVGPRGGTALARLHRAAGVDLRTSTGVSGFVSRHGRLVGISLDDGSTVDADLAVVGVGARPVTHWLRGSGVRLHEDGGVICGPDLRSSVPEIWAAGDVAHVPYELFDGDLMRVEHWTNAAEQGAAAGRSAVRSPEPRTGPAGVPYFWSDWYHHRIQFVGSSRADETVTIGEPGVGVMVLYRRAERMVGALTIDRGGDIMKLRRRIVARGEWDEAVTFGEQSVGETAVRASESTREPSASPA